MKFNQLKNGQIFTFNVKGLRYKVDTLRLRYRTCNGNKFKLISESQFIEVWLIENKWCEMGEIINCFISGKGENKKLYYQEVTPITGDNIQSPVIKPAAAPMPEITHNLSIKKGIGYLIVLSNDCIVGTITKLNTICFSPFQPDTLFLDLKTLQYICYVVKNFDNLYLSAS